MNRIRARLILPYESFNIILNNRKELDKLNFGYDIYVAEYGKKDVCIMDLLIEYKTIKGCELHLRIIKDYIRNLIHHKITTLFKVSSKVY